MFSNRSFQVFVGIALAITITFTVQEALATSLLRAEGKAITTCASLPSRYSFHTEYVKEANLWIIRTEDGPTGVDGGLGEILSAYRTCAR